jgi:hypothetical protein
LVASNEGRSFLFCNGVGRHVSGLVPSVDWLLYSAVRKEALLTFLIEGTQATLTDLFDEEAGVKVSTIHHNRATSRKIGKSADRYRSAGRSRRDDQ